MTSATLDAERFSRHFGVDGKPAPVLEVSGRNYPVEVRYRPLGGGAADEADDEEELEEAIVAAAEDLWREGPGDVLVFLPGEREIRETSDLLAKSMARRPYARTVEILPLFARLSAEQQQRVFSRSGGRRIVIATNVAETSLTVPGIRYVIDSGLARVKRYSLRNKVTQLQIEKIAQAAAEQRAGRCGRVAAGVCVRLYAAEDFAARPKYTEPEILRSSLAAVILRMAALDLTAVDAFPFLERPSPRAIADGYQLLEELGAVDTQRRAHAAGPRARRAARRSAHRPDAACGEGRPDGRDAGHRQRTLGARSSRASAGKAPGGRSGAPALSRRTLGLPEPACALAILRRRACGEAVASEARRAMPRALRFLSAAARVARPAPAARRAGRRARLEVDRCDSRQDRCRPLRGYPSRAARWSFVERRMPRGRRRALPGHARTQVLPASRFGHGEERREMGACGRADRHDTAVRALRGAGRAGMDRAKRGTARSSAAISIRSGMRRGAKSLPPSALRCMG